MCKMRSLKDERIGIKKINKYGSLMVVKDYIRADKIVVYFPKYNYTMTSTWKSFNNGTVKSPYCRTVFGIGYLGEGKYNAYDKYDKPTLYYSRWKAILNRCYYNKNKEYDMNDTYTGICQIEDYLLNFQNFCEWLDEQLKYCPFDEWYIDKDILEKGNKIYDRKHMILVDKRLNNLFTKSDKARGKLPIGCYPRDDINKIYVQCGTYENGRKKNEYLGSFPPNQVNEAFQCYKQFKENYIKQVADEYYSQGLIPLKLYQAMYNYEVEITD